MMDVLTAWIFMGTTFVLGFIAGIVFCSEEM